jgi:predicted PurR-regulated permease PerM
VTSTTPPNKGSLPHSESSVSPKWGQNAKLIVGLSLVALVVIFLFYFRSLIGPILMAFVLSYLLHPVIDGISSLTRLTWRGTVNLVYIFLVILLATSFTLTGLAVANQIQNLITVVGNFVNNLPQFVEELSTQIFVFGPFELDMRTLDLAPLAERVLSYLQPILSRLGDLVGTFATSAAASIGWGLFILVISYFLLAESRQVPKELTRVEVPGYDEDIRRLALELRKVWNAFLRGQLIVITLVIISYTFLMTVLGVRYALAIALLAGLSRFAPYLGPLIAWTVLALVTFFQSSNYFNLDPWQYTLLVLIAAIVLDQIFDNLVSPRVFGQTLGIHPAAVLITALIAANLIGLIGLILAAPTVATVKLIWRYVFRKMLDLDPWPLVEPEERVPTIPVHIRASRLFRNWYSALKQKQ